MGLKKKINHKKNGQDRSDTTESERRRYLLTLLASAKATVQGCLTENELAAFCEDRLEAGERQKTISHLNQCRDCYNTWISGLAIRQNEAEIMIRSQVRLAAESKLVEAACPSVEILAAFSAGSLPEKKRLGIIHHLNRCPTCYDIWLTAENAFDDKGLPAVTPESISPVHGAKLIDFAKAAGLRVKQVMQNLKYRKIAAVAMAATVVFAIGIPVWFDQKEMIAPQTTGRFVHDRAEPRPAPTASIPAIQPEPEAETTSETPKPDSIKDASRLKPSPPPKGARFSIFQEIKKEPQEAPVSKSAKTRAKAKKTAKPIETSKSESPEPEKSLGYAHPPETTVAPEYHYDKGPMNRVAGAPVMTKKVQESPQAGQEKTDTRLKEIISIMRNQYPIMVSEEQEAKNRQHVKLNLDLKRFEQPDAPAWYELIKTWSDYLTLACNDPQYISANDFWRAQSRIDKAFVALQKLKAPHPKATEILRLQDDITQRIESMPGPQPQIDACRRIAKNAYRLYRLIPN